MAAREVGKYIPGLLLQGEKFSKHEKGMQKVLGSWDLRAATELSDLRCLCPLNLYSLLEGSGKKVSEDSPCDQ